MRNISSILLTLAVGLAVGSCGAIKQVPVESNTATSVNIKDSTIYHIVDSVRIHEKTRYKEYGGLLDTLVIDGARSHMRAWTDTTLNILNGTLEEDEIEEKTHIEYKDREVAVHDTTYIEKQVPYKVEIEKKKTPAWCWWVLVWSVATTLILAFQVYLKFKK